MDNHGNRTEVAMALSGRVGVSTRYSNTLRQEMMYVAVPVIESGKIVGSIRVSLPVTTIAHTLDVIYLRLTLVGLLVAVIAAVLSLLVSRRISRPLEEMTRGAQRFAQGRLDQPLPRNNFV